MNLILFVLNHFSHIHNRFLWRNNWIQCWFLCSSVDIALGICCICCGIHVRYYNLKQCWSSKNKDNRQQYPILVNVWVKRQPKVKHLLKTNHHDDPYINEEVNNLIDLWICHYINAQQHPNWIQSMSQWSTKYLLT